ncbi:MAG: polymer-forming cytoskeletal protein [Bacteroidales bacterium]|jgi:cytoskeletal protein CcmA (bactofilin family)|nr:polymer-forming cytoskeletal protein [Bacteroidales bacterium]HOI32219.1 polymer-forming cytoskeletal protein [Bacteroidales bacterium]
MKHHKSGHDSTTRNLIGNEAIIKGDIQSSGDIRIDGTVIGTLRSNGKIVIGQSGNVEGELVCQQADISGKVKASLQVEELTVLKATAIFEGELTTRKLSIEVGAQFSGKCEMKQTASDEKKQK